MKDAVAEIAAAAIEAAFSELEKAGHAADRKKLAKALVAAVRAKEGFVEVTLVTPTGDAGTAKEGIVAMLEKKLGAVTVREKADPAMLGGIRILIDDVMIDYSLQRAFQDLSSSLSHA